MFVFENKLVAEIFQLILMLIPLTKLCVSANIF